MIRKEKNGIAWLEFPLFQPFPNLVHGVFLRHGGSSSGEFTSLNFSTSVGDSPAAVHANEKKALNLLGLTSAVRGKLCHGKQVALVNDATSPDFPCDGLLTKTPDIGLLITHADCQAAIFYDPVKCVLANVHAGWRGSIQNIYAETIRLMQLQGCCSSDIRVGISPSLGPDEAEFIHYNTELPEQFWRFQIKPKHFDFWSISRMQLEEAGVLPHHIEIAAISTYANPKDYYSYRRDKKTGRHATIAALS